MIVRCGPCARDVTVARGRRAVTFTCPACGTRQGFAGASVRLAKPGRKTSVDRLREAAAVLGPRASLDELAFRADLTRGQVASLAPRVGLEVVERRSTRGASSVYESKQ